MAPVTFEQGIALEKLSEARPPSPIIITIYSKQANSPQNTFRSLQAPWTWPRTTVVPGGIMMALAANAAYQTTQSGFSIDTLSCHFLAAPKANVPFDITVQRLSDGGRFCSRVADLKQAGGLKVHVVCSFVRPASMTGPSMSHSVQRKSRQKLDSITFDDLDVEKTDIGPYMKFQRLPLFYNGTGPTPTNPPPESLVYTSAAQMSPLGSDRDPNIHVLALIALSDYHILDCPPTVSGLQVGTPVIGDTSRRPTESAFQFLTSLNHNIRFHAHDGFRADEVLYVEAESPWTRGRRGQVDSRIFSADGKLLATCAQGAYYAMKEGGERSQERTYVMEGEGWSGSVRSKL